MNSDKPKNSTKKETKSDKKTDKKTSPKRQNKKRINTPPRKTPEHKPGSKIGQQKRLAEPELEFSEPAEFVELKVSSDHSGESESGEFLSGFL